MIDYTLLAKAAMLHDIGVHYDRLPFTCQSGDAA